MTLNERAAHVMGNQLLRILALEVDVETLTRERDEARRERDRLRADQATTRPKAV